MVGVTATAKTSLQPGGVRPSRGLLMAEVTLPGPSTFTTVLLRLLRLARVLMALLLVAGCASWRRSSPIALEVTEAGVAERVLIPSDQNVNLTETVVKPGSPVPMSPDAPATPGVGVGSTIFALPDAIAFGLQNNPRLRSARAAVERAQGKEQMAFAPFLPQFDVFGQYGVTSSNLGPGVPGYTGILRAINDKPHSYQETELALQWTLYDFGRTGGRYRQAVARERIPELPLDRAAQAVEFDVAAAYLEVLLARASRRVQEDAVRRARAFLDDTDARRKGGVALKEDVLRGDVQLAGRRAALILA